MSALIKPISPSVAHAALPAGATFTREPLWQLPVERYHAMIAAGHLTEDDPVELIEGVLVYRMPIDELHNAVCDVLRDLLQPLIDRLGLVYRVQASITLRDSEPQPDGAIVQGPRHHFARMNRKPGVGEVDWIAEVSNTTLRTDRGSKRRVYARAAIPVYWIVNLDEQVVEVYTDPDSTAEEPAYRTMTPYRRGQRIPVVVQGNTVGDIAFDDVLPA